MLSKIITIIRKVKSGSAIFFFGSGKNYLIVPVTQQIYDQIDEMIRKIPDGLKFIDAFNRTFNCKIANRKHLQRILEENKSTEGEYFGPVFLIDKIAELIKKRVDENSIVNNISFDGFHKSHFPKIQLYAIWSIYSLVLKINTDIPSSHFE